MRMHKTPLLLAALLLSTTSAIAAEPADTAEKLRDQALAGNHAWAILEGLTTEIGPRLAGTADEARARDWAVKKLTALGFSNVRVEPFDMPVWVRGAEEAAIVSPFPQKLTVSALGGSGSTPAKGIEAELVAFASVAALEAADPAAVRGKIVFVNHRMMPTMDGSSYGYFGAVRRSAPSIAASKGAAAIVIRSLGTDHHRNPHTGQTNWAEGVKPIPAAALSLPDAEQIERALSRGQPLRLKLLLTPRQVGVRPSGNVIAEIPGSDPSAGVVLAGGHLDSWDLGTGAIDDGAGVAITAAAAKRILDSGQQPKRTIRIVWWGAEEVGLLGAKAYAKAHGAEPHALAGESDFGAGRVWQLSSHVAEADLPAVRDMANVLAPLGVALGDNQSHGGPDVGPLSALGIPVVEPTQDGLDYFNLHHTPDDTLDKIDSKALDQNVAAWTAILWLAANGEAGFGQVSTKP